MTTASLSLDGKEYELPVITGSEGEIGVDIGRLRGQAGAITLDPATGEMVVPWIRKPWFFGIDAQGIGTIGMLLNFAVTLGLTPLCKPPSQKVREMVDSVREPEGDSPAVMIETAPGH